MWFSSCCCDTFTAAYPGLALRSRLLVNASKLIMNLPLPGYTAVWLGVFAMQSRSTGKKYIAFRC
jgi:hypothetical protein